MSAKVVSNMHQSVQTILDQQLFMSFIPVYTWILLHMSACRCSCPPCTGDLAGLWPIAGPLPAKQGEWSKAPCTYAC